MDDDDEDDEDDSEEFIDDEESDFDEEKQEAEISMEAFKSEVKDKDEYEVFRTTIHYLKQKQFFDYINFQQSSRQDRTIED